MRVPQPDLNIVKRGWADRLMNYVMAFDSYNGEKTFNKYNKK